MNKPTTIQIEPASPNRMKNRKVSVVYGYRHLGGRTYSWWVMRNKVEIAGGTVWGGIKQAQTRSHAVAMALFELELKSGRKIEEPRLPRPGEGL